VKVLKVKTKPEYEILIGKGIFKSIPEDMKSRFDFGKVAIITDSNVRNLYGDELKKLFEKAGVKAEIFDFPAGEQSKNTDTVVSLARRMVSSRFDRKDIVVALGGGVAGDIAGFLASIYLRGIPFVQVPTTLLAQVDSSVGGKTGVDLPEGKNLLGTFYQPLRVYIDTDFLKTLPLLELKNGLAEVVKYGCILRRTFFYYLKRLGKKFYELSEDVLTEVIFQSVKAKAWVVSRDEKESGLRRILNFGHTVGHAIETEFDYRVPHGLAVAVGMVAEARLSETFGVAEEKVADRVINLLKELELPTKISDIPGAKGKKLSEDSMVQSMLKDKKVWKGKLTIVLLKKIGKTCFYEVEDFVPVKEVLKEVV